MKRNIVLIASFLIMSAAFAQKNAVTEDGKNVILNADGTWLYAKVDSVKNDESTIGEFKKPITSTELKKSDRVNVGFWYNPQKWVFEKSPLGETNEFRFKHKKGDGYAMVVSERIQMGIEDLRELAIGNASNVSKDFMVEKEEYRMINGIKMLHLIMSGKIKGVTFIYNGYYYSGEDGIVQYITYTGKSLFKEYEKDFYDLLNGFVKVKEAKK
jgi:hypothetical protein